MRPALAFTAALLCLGGRTATAVPAVKVSQYGITWYFDKAYETGTFANGDYWVSGPVTIDSITPGFNGVNHGWQVNPRSNSSQGFAAGAGGFSAALVPTLPYTALPGQSIVKGISKNPGDTADCYDTRCLTTAAILTVVDGVPPDSGSSVLRPPYAGVSKPYYSLKGVRTDLLPSYQAVAGAPPLASIAERFKRVQFHHGQGRMGRCIRPESNQHDYQPENAADQNEAILRLMLNDRMENKMPALVPVLQAGIDAYHAVLDGQTWPQGGGYEPGHKMLISFAAALLNNQEMKNTVNAKEFWLEHKLYYRSKKTGTILWGLTPPEGSWKTQKDTAEYIDAPTTDYGGDAYLVCCLATPIKTATLAVYLMPALGAMWQGEPWALMSAFIDRWVTRGWWTLPDPYNRFPEKHGTQADAGAMATTFTQNMWKTYRHGAGTSSGRQIKEKEIGELTIHNNPCQKAMPVVLELSLPSPRKLIWAIYNPGGREIKKLGQKAWPSTIHKVYWDCTDQNGRRVESGVYIVRAKSEGMTISRLITVIK